MSHSAHLGDVSASSLSAPTPIEDALLSKADIDLSPASKRVRLAASLPHRNSLRESRDPLPAPLPITSAYLPRHLKAFARLAPRPRARIIIADVHRMGRIAVHADVFAQIIEAEERVMGPGAARTQRACLEGELPGLGELPEFPTGPIANSSLSDSVASEDGADARTALLARASVQDFIARRTARAVVQHTPSGDVVRCICRAGADGRPMIQCSDCRTWAHRICMDAPVAGTQWRCWRCAPTKPAPESVFQPTFVPNSTPSRRIVVPPPIPMRAPQWQPSPLLPPVPLPETPERAAAFPFHSFITPRFFADFARRDTDDEGDAEVADGSPRRQRVYSPVQSPKRPQSPEEDEPMRAEPSPNTPPPLRSNGTTTPMTPERSTGPRPQPQHSGSTVADSTGPASPTGVGGGLYAGTGACSGPDVFSGEVSVYADEYSPVQQRRAHRVWQLGTGSNAKASSDVSVRRGDTVAS
ncbi:hypothetical protein FRC11_011848 [Ceratobasidium sp. 423]|nr:hypothetical protein FRC11_011848 [Ceratobasidium sp. 423]